MQNEEQDEYLSGTNPADPTTNAASSRTERGGDLWPRKSTPSAERNLDAELTPSPRQTSPLRLALYAGIALFPVIPVLLVLVAYLTADGDFSAGVFSVALMVIAAIAGLVGLLILIIAGFLLLIYRGDEDKETEVFGSATPAYDRGQAAPETVASLDLRLGWGPALLYLVFFAGAQFARPLLVGSASGLDAGIVEIVGGILNVLALLLFLFFWTAGYVRQNRAGVLIAQNFYLAALFALLAFFLPVILI